MNKDYMEELWFEIFMREIGASSQRKVAEKLGYSITTVNQIAKGKYAGSTTKVAEKVILVYTQIKCPFNEQIITMQDCREQAHAPAPTHNPMKMQHWKACLKCPKRPS